jgi:hypothetical protein
MLAAMDQARQAWITAIGDIHTVTQYIAKRPSRSPTMRER